MPNQSISVTPAAALQNVLGYQFENQDLLRQALTHKSAITERHPMAFNLDLAPLALVGDAVLRYCAARYLFRNGQRDIVESCAKLHEDIQKVISNQVLAGIAQYKHHLENYLVRGNNHKTPSQKMYADCMEAIFGAIALDCGIDRQEVIFRLIANLCFHPIEECLVETFQMRLVSYDYEESNRQHLKRIVRKSKRQFEEALHKRSCCRILCRCLFWLFIIIIIIVFIAALCAVIFQENIFTMQNKRKRGWFDL